MHLTSDYATYMYNGAVQEGCLCSM